MRSRTQNPDPAFLDADAAGFTLLELMLVISILTALLLLALPSWHSYLQQQARAQARQTLLALAQKLEHYRSLNADYAMPLAPQLPVDEHYVYSYVGSPDANSYTLQAQPTGDQARDSCGTLLLNAAAQRGAGGVLDNRAAVTLRCWPR